MSSDSKESTEKGMLKIEGSTAARYYVTNASGEEIASKRLNESVIVDPGHYEVIVNQSRHHVKVEAGLTATCATGTLMVSGATDEVYQVLDTLNQTIGSEVLGRSISVFPGRYTAQVNNTRLIVEVKLRALTEIHTGTLLLTGNSADAYYVLDESRRQLNHNILGKPLAFFPGSYSLKVNNTSLKTEVFGRQLTQINTGSLLVKGLTEEYYYVTDTLGNALNYRNLNKPISFLPGDLVVTVNNTTAAVRIDAGKTTEIQTGSIVLTGEGTEYYYVLDETGKELHYTALNKSLSLFPAEYAIRLGAGIRRATVTAGELTSVNFSGAEN